MWLLAVVVVSWVHAFQVDPKAISCLEKFVTRYESSQGYSTQMKKTEFEFDEVLTENIEIVEIKGQSTQLKFVDPGRSGIRNNGMTVTYIGERKVKIEFGRSKGFGIFLNALAETFTIKTRDVFDADVVEKQIFTINRAGFGFMAKILRQNLEKLKQGLIGDLASISEKCSIRFSRANETETFLLSKKSDIQGLEDKYGTLAYLIYKNNADKFKSFDKFLNFKDSAEIEIPKHFSDFKLELDKNNLPTHFELIFRGETIGSYDFKNTNYF